MVLIGSKAMKHWFPDFHRNPKDGDFALTYKPERNVEKDHNGGILEFHYNPVIAESYIFSSSLEIISPQELLTLKVSHLFWDINWSKHMFDVQFLLKKGLRIDYSLFKRLFDFWEVEHGPRQTSDLSLSKDAFFDNALKTYDHDYLHALISSNVPVYKLILKQGSEVEPDEMKFYDLTHSQKLELVREEICVMSYERLAGRDYRVAYGWMLKKFIMNHAPMWEALWIIENYIELHKPIINYKQILDYELQRNHQGTI